MKPIPQSSSWHLPPTFRQQMALAKLGVRDEDLPTTRWEARRLIYELRQRKKGEQDNGVQ